MKTIRTVYLIGCVLVAARYGWMYGAGALVGGWLLHSWLFPWRKCWWWWCKGNPTNYDGPVNHNIWCPVCGSKGRIRRWGSRLARGGFGRL